MEDTVSNQPSAFEGEKVDFLPVLRYFILFLTTQERKERTMADERLVEMLKRSVKDFGVWRVNVRHDPAEIDLSGADFSDCRLDGACLSGVNLQGANFRGAHLCGATLQDADLTRANLIGADLSGATLGGACISGADFDRANLTGVEFRGVEGLETACFCEATVEPKAQRVILAAVAESMRDPK